jgi:hypothetical protein
VAALTQYDIDASGDAGRSAQRHGFIERMINPGSFRVVAVLALSRCAVQLLSF